MYFLFYQQYKCRLCILQVSFAWGTRLLCDFIRGTRHKKFEDPCYREFSYNSYILHDWDLIRARRVSSISPHYSLQSGIGISQLAYIATRDSPRETAYGA
jgi:hypothetical protein